MDLSPIHASSTATFRNPTPFSAFAAAVVFVGGFVLSCDRESPTPPADSDDGCLLTPERLERPKGFRQAPRPAGRSQLKSLGNDQVTLVTPMPKHRWISKRHVVETIDGGLGFHVYASSGREADRYRLRVVVLADYQPVDARVVLWNGDRTKKLGDHAVASGLFQETTVRVMAADVVLPPKTVPMGGWREIQTVVELAPLDRESSDDADLRRWIVYNGSRPPEAVGCLKGAPADERRRGVVASLAEEKIAIGANLPETGDAALLPLLDGRPVGQPTFVRGTESGVSWEGAFGRPEDAGGSYFVAVWREPYGVGGDAPVLSTFRSSNVLTLE